MENNKRHKEINLNIKERKTKEQMLDVLSHLKEIRLKRSLVQNIVLEERRTSH